MNVREKLMSGQKAVGTMCRVIRNPAIAYFAKNAGLDFVHYDCEHSNYNMETLHDIFMMYKALGIEGFLRVPKGTSDYISRALDAGATGVIVPVVETAAYAREIVKWSKYPPIGQRGFTVNSAHTWYLPQKHVDIIEESNNKVVTIVQIETVKGVENVDEIAAVEGVDVLLVGQNDLSVSMGVPGEITGDAVMSAIKTVIAACQRHGKIFSLGADPGYLFNFKEALGLVIIGSDVAFLNKGFNDVMTGFQSLL